MNNRLLFFSLLLMTFAFIFQCTKEESNPVGARYFQRNDKGAQYSQTLYAASTDTFYNTHITVASSIYLHVGKDGDTQAKTLIRFSSVPQGVHIDSAFLKIYVSQWLAENGNSLDIEAYHITESWSESVVTWDNFDESIIGEKAMEFSIQPGEADSIILAIPQTILDQWSDTSSTSTNYGLFLESVSEGQIIQLFSYNSDYSPVLTVYTLDEEDSTVVDETQYTPSSDAFISDTHVEGNTDYLFVSNGQPLGIPSRILLSFDIPEFPENTTINGALLNFTPDTTLSQPDHSESFGLIAYPVTDESWPISQVPYDTSLVTVGTVDQDSASIDITDIVQNWIYGGLDNFGLVVMSNISRTSYYERAFYSSACQDSTRMPQLVIYYSIAPASNKFE